MLTIETIKDIENKLEKLAAIKASSLDDLARILSNSGKKFDEPVEDIVRKVYNGHGTGSIFLDLAKATPKKLLRFGGKKVQSTTNPKKFVRQNTVGDRVTNKIDDAVSSYQKKLYDADVRAGNFLDKHLKTDAFITKQQFKTKTEPGKIQEVLEVNVPKLTAPIEKGKDVILPFAGSMAIASTLDKLYYNNKGGDAVNENKIALDRKEMIDKIASMENNNSIQQNISNQNSDLKTSFIKMSQLANQTVEMLKTASYTIKEKDSINQKLASENEKLKLQVTALIRSERAEKLAQEMLNKGIIKKANFNAKTEEIMKLSDEAYVVLEKTVSEINPLHKEASEGIDSLDFEGYVSLGRENRGKSSFSEEIINLERTL